MDESLFDPNFALHWDRIINFFNAALYFLKACNLYDIFDALNYAPTTFVSWKNEYVSHCNVLRSSSPPYRAPPGRIPSLFGGEYQACCFGKKCAESRPDGYQTSNFRIFGNFGI
jgi:hypothetical protein